MSKKYFDTKTGSLEEKITKIATEQSSITKPKSNVKLTVEKSYFGVKPGSVSDVAAKIVSEGLDPVNKDAVKKKFDDRKDKDIDNDGDIDSSDKYLHTRRSAISKNLKEIEGTSGGGIYALRAIRDKRERLQDELRDLDKKDPNYQQKADNLKKQIENQKEIMKRKQREVFGSYDPSLKEDDMGKFHQMQKDGKSADEIAKALGLDVKSVKKLMDLDEAIIIKSMLEQYFRKKVLDEKVGDDAKRMGLTYYKFGRYGKDGKVTHTSKDGKLVSIPKKDQKSVSQAPKAAQTANTPKKSAPSAQPKTVKANPIQISKQADKAINKMADTSYTKDNYPKLAKDLSSTIQLIKSMTDADKTQGSAGDGYESSKRAFKSEVIDTFQNLDTLYSELITAKEDIKDEEAQDILDNIITDMDFISDEDADHDGYTKDGKVRSAIDDLVANSKKLEKRLGSVKEAVDEPYAVGMAQAKKLTGDKPPLEKSTITKAHDIAKSIMKKEQICPKCGKDHANKINASNCMGESKKTFSNLRTETKVIKLGDKGKTATGKDAAAVDVEPSTKPI